MRALDGNRWPLFVCGGCWRTLMKLLRVRREAERRPARAEESELRRRSAEHVGNLDEAASRLRQNREPRPGTRSEQTGPIRMRLAEWQWEWRRTRDFAAVPETERH